MTMPLSAAYDRIRLLATALFRTTLCLILMALSTGAHSHSSNIGSFQLQQLSQDAWVYKVMVPLYALDTSMRTVQPDAPKADLSSTAYKEAIVAYVKSGFKVTAYNSDEDAVALQLGEARIKLGHHMSVLLFEVKHMPKAPSLLQFTLDNMHNSPNQQNVLRISHSQQQQRHVLNQDNGFSGTASLQFSE